MNGEKLITALKRKLRVSTDAALSRALGVSQVALANWRNTLKLTPRQIAKQFGRLLATQARGDKILLHLKKKFRTKSLAELERRLGVSGAAIQQWKNSRALTALQIAGMVKKASTAAIAHTHATAVRPVVEFFKIAKKESKQGAKFELFVPKSDKEKTNLYLGGLKDELKNHHGVYIFFDSRGQAIYAGKARKLDLWKEMTDAFNRNRGPVQKIKRVRHPERNQAYRTSDEKARQIRDIEVPLNELAAYFSAYEVTDALIEDLEALLVRSFANDLLNKRMERFGRQRAVKKTRSHRRRRKAIGGSRK